MRFSAPTDGLVCPDSIKDIVELTTPAFFCKRSLREPIALPDLTQASTDFFVDALRHRPNPACSRNELARRLSGNQSKPRPLP